MTIRKRLFWSNIMMILVPVFSTLLVGLLCVGFIWVYLIKGTGLGMHDQEDFNHACMAITEMIDGQLEEQRNPADSASLHTILTNSHMTVRVREGAELLFSVGREAPEDKKLIAASKTLQTPATLGQNGRFLYVQHLKIHGRQYEISIFGGVSSEKSYWMLKQALLVTILLLALTIFLSIFLANRFLIRFVFRKIQSPLEILSNGVHELRDGNLAYRISYGTADEFLPVCEDFNEMAGRLQDSVRVMERQEESRKELIAGISHDLRSPLTSIQAYVEGLLDGIARTPEAQQKYLKTILTKAKDLSQIVSQLFLFSKMEVGDYPIHPEQVRLDQILHQIFMEQREEYAEKGLQIHEELLPAMVFADPVQLQRLTVNLTENSLKYKTAPMGHLYVSMVQKGEILCLSFADDGPGVPEDALPHLFEVFYRSDPARKNPHQGSGLGLAIVAKIVEQMQGTISADRSAEGGLEIRILLPMEDIDDGQDTDH